MFTLGIGRVACAATFAAVASSGKMAPPGPANPVIGLLDDVNLESVVLERAISDKAELALSFLTFGCASTGCTAIRCSSAGSPAFNSSRERNIQKIL